MGLPLPPPSRRHAVVAVVASRPSPSPPRPSTPAHQRATADAEDPYQQRSAVLRLEPARPSALPKGSAFGQPAAVRRGRAVPAVGIGDRQPGCRPVEPAGAARAAPPDVAADPVVQHPAVLHAVIIRPKRLHQGPHRRPLDHIEASAAHLGNAHFCQRPQQRRGGPEPRQLAVERGAVRGTTTTPRPRPATPLLLRLLSLTSLSGTPCASTTRWPRTTCCASGFSSQWRSCSSPWSS